MSDKYGVGQDPYCYPGTRVLKNRLGLKDDATLERAETEIAATALRDIQNLSVTGGKAFLYRYWQPTALDPKIIDMYGKRHRRR